MSWLSFSAGFVACLLVIGASFCFTVFLWLHAEESDPELLPGAYLRISLGPNSYIQGIHHMRLTNEQRVLVTAVALTAGGHPAPIDGEVIFGTSDAGVADIERVDATSAYVTAVGEGAAQITASFDADLGEGVRTIELSGAIEVVAAEAERGEIQFGEPELIPTPPTE
jgi:hypothetical protein